MGWTRPCNYKPSRSPRSYYRPWQSHQFQWWERRNVRGSQWCCWLNCLTNSPCRRNISTVGDTLPLQPPTKASPTDLTITTLICLLSWSVHAWRRLTHHAVFSNQYNAWRKLTCIFFSVKSKLIQVQNTRQCCWKLSTHLSQLWLHLLNLQPKSIHLSQQINSERPLLGGKKPSLL